MFREVWGKLQPPPARSRRRQHTPRLALPFLEALEDRYVLSTLLSTETLVNTYTTSTQYNPDIARDNNGNFVIVWQSFGQDGSGWGIYGQRYDATGTKVGGEFLINQVTAGHQTNPAVAMDADGDFVVVWEGEGTGTISSTYRDQFPEADNYNGNNGTQAWSDLWFEVDNAGAGPTSGRVSIATDQSDLRLRMQGGGGNTISATRSVDLERALTATLSYIFRRNSMEVGDHLVVEMSTGDGTWVEVDRVSGVNGSDSGYSTRTITINSALFSSSTQLRFRTQDMNDNDDVVFIDNVQIAYTSTNTEIFMRRYNAAGVAQGGQVQVNTVTTGHQARPDVASEDNGDFVVVWQSEQTTGNFTDIYARRYNAAGTALAAQFWVNDSARNPGSNNRHLGFQQNAAVAMDADGDFIVVWEDSYPPGGWGIFAQRVNNAGTAQGNWFQVNTTAAGEQRYPDAAMHSDGTFTLTWQSDGQDGSGYGIYAKRYNATGGVLNNEFLVNQNTAGQQTKVRVAYDQNGYLAFAWQSDSMDGSGLAAVVRRFGPTTTALTGDVQVNWTMTGDQSAPALITWNGTFEVTWQGNGVGDDRGVFLNHCGLAGGTIFQVNNTTAGGQRAPAVATEDNGDFVVVWVSSDGSGYGVYARRYNSLGVALGNEFRVNQTTAGAQTNPSVAMDSDGDFVVVWSHWNGTSYDVYGRRYSNTGAAVGNEFLIASNPASPEPWDSSVPMVAMNDTHFIVTWSRYVNAARGWDVFARGFVISGNTQVGMTEMLVNTNLAGDQKRPTVDIDAAGDVVITWTHDYGPAAGTGDIYYQRYILNRTYRDEFNAVAYSGSDGTENWTPNPWVENDVSGALQSPTQGNVQVVNTVGAYTMRFQGGSGVVRAYRPVNLGSTTATSATVTFDYLYVQTESADTLAVEYSINNGASWIAMSTVNGGGTRSQWYTYSFTVTSAGFFNANTLIRITSTANSTNEFFYVDNFQVAFKETTAFVAVGGNVVVDASPGMQALSAVDMDSSGNFVITWTDAGTGYDIYAKRYNASGVQQGGAFLVNQATAGIQVDSKVALHNDGTIVFTWTGSGPDNPDGSYGVYARRFSGATATSGDLLIAHPFTADHQALADVVVDSNGDLTVVWNSWGQDGSGYGVYGRRITNVCGYNLTSIAGTLALTGGSSSSLTTSGFSTLLSGMSSSNGSNLSAQTDALLRISTLNVPVDVPGGNFLINIFFTGLRRAAVEFLIDDEVVDTFATDSSGPATVTTVATIKPGKRVFSLRALDAQPLASTLLFDFLELFRLGDSE